MKTNDSAAVRATVFGNVQGVFFRAFATRKAKELGIKGYVRNQRAGDSVEVVAEGERERLRELISHLMVGPAGAKVTKVDTNWTMPSGRFTDFSVRY